jgi:hypothetical protein
MATELSTGITSKGNNEITFRIVIVSILIGIATQLGLFLSPWALNWNDWYQKMVSLSMLPSILWLFSQIYYDAGEALTDSRSGIDFEVYMHVIEACVMAAFLIVYAIQGIRVSRGFLRKPVAPKKGATDF